jgi:hypothetical protein
VAAELDLDTVKGRAEYALVAGFDTHMVDTRQVLALVAEVKRLRVAAADEQERADEFVNQLLEHAPDHYDGDEAAEDIALRYVRDIEAAVALHRPGAYRWVGGQALPSCRECGHLSPCPTAGGPPVGMRTLRDASDARTNGGLA